MLWVGLALVILIVVLALRRSKRAKLADEWRSKSPPPPTFELDSKTKGMLDELADQVFDFAATDHLFSVSSPSTLAQTEIGSTFSHRAAYRLVVIGGVNEFSAAPGQWEAVYDYFVDACYVALDRCCKSLSSSPTEVDEGKGMFDPEIDWDLDPDIEWEEEAGEFEDSDEGNLLYHLAYTTQDFVPDREHIEAVVRWDKAAVDSWLAKHHLTLYAQKSD
jgi:hypothetical protein